MVSVPEASPLPIWVGMFALEAALKPAKPSWRDFSTDLSSPRYARRACSSELTSSLQPDRPAQRKETATSETTRREGMCMALVYCEPAKRAIPEDSLHTR